MYRRNAQKKLALKRETVRTLVKQQLEEVAGGAFKSLFASCTCPPWSEVPWRCDLPYP